MASDEPHVEPVVDRYSSTSEVVESKPKKRSIGPSFFTLSGGILKRDPRTANRIDSLLSKMMEHPSTGPYSKHVEKNLDYLYTCLQLDMISLIAQEAKPRLELEAETPRPEDEMNI